MDMNQFYNPVRTFQGADCMLEFDAVLNEMKNRPQHVLLLVRSSEVLETQGGGRILNALEGSELYVHIFADSEPDIGQLYRMYQMTSGEDIDLVIAVGGGSTMDLGKVLCCLYTNRPSSEDELRCLIREKNAGPPKCPWIGVPTTAGTGSEITCWATIWDRVYNQKLSVDRTDNYAYAAFVDPEFTMTMPLQLTVSSALDAVAHAAEAYWARHSNLVSRIYSLAAIEEVMSFLPRLIEDEKNPGYRECMGKGSMLAGLAFSNTRTTACHSISYPLTLNYHIPHGVAVSILLAPVMSINASEIEDPKRFYAAFGAKDIREVKSKIHQILAGAGIACRLRDWNVKEEDLEELSAHCFTKGRIDNNPVALTQESVEDILREIY